MARKRSVVYVASTESGRLEYASVTRDTVVAVLEKRGCIVSEYVPDYAPGVALELEIRALDGAIASLTKRRDALKMKAARNG